MSAKEANNESSFYYYDVLKQLHATENNLGVVSKSTGWQVSQDHLDYLTGESRSALSKLERNKKRHKLLFNLFFTLDRSYVSEVLIIKEIRF